MVNRVGQKLGNYRLIRLTGHGGFADVYLGEHIYLNTQAAIKVLHSRFPGEILQNFLTEARMIARLNHPNIVHVLDFGIEDRIPFLVMHYAPYGTLRQQHPLGSMLAPSLIISYVKQVAAALQYAHGRNIVHRDVKPENMLCSNDGTVLLSDFGIAVTSHLTHDNETHDVFNPGDLRTLGTTTYMAPEQFYGEPCYASDQYSLAITVYEWFCGIPPFSGSNLQVALNHLYMQPTSLRAKVAELNPAIERVIMKALAKKPQERFAHIQDFANELEAVSLLTSSRTYTYPRISILEQATFPNTAAIHLPLKDNAATFTRIPSFSSSARMTSVSPSARIPSMGATQSVLEHIRQSPNHTFAHMNQEKSAAVSLLDVPSLTRETQNIGGRTLILRPMMQMQPLITNTPTMLTTMVTNGLSVTTKKKRGPLLAFIILCFVMALLPLLQIGFSPVKKQLQIIATVSGQTQANATVIPSSLSTPVVQPIPSLIPTQGSFPQPNTIPPTVPLPNTAPSPTPVSLPSPMPTQAPSPTPTPVPPSPVQFTATPSSISPSRCVPDNSNYRCTITLFLSADYPGKLFWRTASNVDAHFSTGKGILDPGHSRQVIVYIPQTCPEHGVLVFHGTDISSTVKWTC